MEKFTFQNPVKIYFGKGTLENLEKELKDYTRILLCYGSGSIKKTGIYEQVYRYLKDKEVFELKDITPNPRASKVYEGIKLCKEHKIDLILAVGGGSTIDCAKAISAGSKTEKDFWTSFFVNKEELEDSTPIATVLTMVGTGSEMDAGGVITNEEVKIKCSYGSPLLYPKFSILDPTFTYTVPKKQMISGTVDMFSHIMEVYFSEPDTDNVSDSLAEGLMKSVIRNIKVALQDPENYEARSNLMWASTLAINGLLALGKGQDWTSHTLEHTLSAYYDIPHGLGLAIVHPTYLRYVYKGHEKKFRKFAENVFDYDTKELSDDQAANKAINLIQDFFREIGAPTRLHEVGIDDSRIEEMANNTDREAVDYSDLSLDDIIQIYKNAL